MKTLLSLFAAALLAVIPTLAGAELGPIFITPTRTAQAGNSSSATVFVLNASDIEASGATTTSELLRSIPGLQVDDLFGNGTDVSLGLRGFSSTANANILVLVNGRRLNHSDIANPDLHHIFPRDIERIEVLSGSAGTLYGDQAVGGVVNIITRRPGKNRQQVSIETGSYNYRGLQFLSTGPIADQLAYRLSAGRFSADHYRDHNSEENTNIQATLDYRLEQGLVYVEIQRIEDELELPGALLEAEFEDDPRQINAGFSGDFINEDTAVNRIGYERQLGAHRFSIDATARETDAGLLQSFRDSPSPAAGFTRRENRALNPKLSGRFVAGLAIDYVAGIDFETTDFDLSIPNTFGSTVRDNQQQNRSLFFQLNPQLTERLRLTVGMRRSEVDNKLTDGFSFPDGIEVDDEISVAELGLAWQLDDISRLSFRIDENFRFAKVDELVFAAPGNILKTQTGQSLEIGYAATFGMQQLTATLYQLDLVNEIEFDSVNFVNVNLDDTRRRGINLGWLWQASRALEFNAQAGFIEAQFSSGIYSGNTIPGVAGQLLRLRGDYRLDDNWKLHLEGRYRSPRYPSGDNDNAVDKLDSTTIYNAGAGYRYQAWSAELRINNLADESTIESANNFGAVWPSPGRNLVLQLSYRFE